MRCRTLLRLPFAALLVPVIGLLFVSAAPIRLFAADESKPAAAADHGPKGKSPLPEVPRPEQRWGEKVVALGLWVTIVVVGLVLLTVVMVWGRWVRKMARRKPTASTVPDPLWYLKTKPPAGSTAAAGSAPPDPSRRSDDGDPGSDGSGRVAL
jgi:hypothetical protein